MERGLVFDSTKKGLQADSFRLLPLIYLPVTDTYGIVAVRGSRVIALQYQGPLDDTSSILTGMEYKNIDTDKLSWVHETNARILLDANRVTENPVRLDEELEKRIDFPASFYDAIRFVADDLARAPAEMKGDPHMEDVSVVIVPALENIFEIMRQY